MTRLDPEQFEVIPVDGAPGARFARLYFAGDGPLPGPSFFETLRRAFHRVPGLFCATAGPGKACDPGDPIRREPPFPGESQTYVLFGDRTRSLYDTAKWRALGGFADLFELPVTEDRDLCYRAWRLGWPSVFVAGIPAAPVAADPRIERDHLRFLAHAITAPRQFSILWRSAIRKLRDRAAEHPEAAEVLRSAAAAPSCIRPQPPPILPAAEILALTSGDIAVFPGRSPRGRPVIMIATTEPPFPPPDSRAERIYGLMRASAADYDLALVCFVRDERRPPAAEIQAVCVEVVQVRLPDAHTFPDHGRPDMVEKYDRPAFHAAVRATIRKWRPAIAQLEGATMAQYAPDCAPARTVLVQHEIAADACANLLKRSGDWEVRRQHRRWIPFEHDTWGRVDRIVTTSEKDRLRIGRPHTVVIPNAVDVERYRPGQPPSDPARLLFAGSFDRAADLDAIDWFLREVWPQLDALSPTLQVIAGPRPESCFGLHRPWLDLGHPRIRIEEAVADLRTAYAEAAIVIAPWLTRAGDVPVLTAMAMGKAVVSTRTAAEDFCDRIRPGEEIVVVETADDMAAAIAGAIAYPALRDAIGARARSAAVERLGWEKVAPAQRSLYEALLRR